MSLHHSPSCPLRLEVLEDRSTPATTGVVGALSNVGVVNNLVVVYSASGAVQQALDPFPGFRGPLRVASGDINNDGTDDIIVATGPGRNGPIATSSSHVKVYDGVTLALTRSFLAFPGYPGGVDVAAADVNGDNRDDIIVGAGPGAPGGHVEVFDGQSGQLIRSFLSFPGFNGGVNVAGGRVDGDANADIIVGAATVVPVVAVFNGLSGAPLAVFASPFPNYAGGVDVAYANGLVLASQLSGGSLVNVYVGPSVTFAGAFPAYPLGFPANGVNVDSRDVDGDGDKDIVLAPVVGPAFVRAFDAATLAPTAAFIAFPGANFGLNV